MEELKKYEEPEMEIKFLDWSDIVTSSDGEGTGNIQGGDEGDLPDIGQG